MTPAFKPFFWPPSLLTRQLGSALLMAYLNDWRKFPQWLARHSLRSIPVSNGALGMGCIGYPGHPVWEVTAACNLRCIHCHATSGIPDPHELDTDEGKRLIDQIAELSEFRTLIYTGGEPLVRPDIFTLLRHSQAAGFINIIATNGTLIDEEMAWKLKDHGVACHAISLDAADPDVHNFLRNNPQAYDLALRAIAATKKAGILLQVNTTAMEYNIPHLNGLIDFVEANDAGIMRCINWWRWDGEKDQERHPEEKRQSEPQRVDRHQTAARQDNYRAGGGSPVLALSAGEKGI